MYTAGQKGFSNTQICSGAKNNLEKSTDAEAAGGGLQRDVESDAWRAALARAEGAKVYDDPKQLRRTIKAEAKAKEKRQDAWKERTERQKQGMAEKQQKCVTLAHAEHAQQCSVEPRLTHAASWPTLRHISL